MRGCVDEMKRVGTSVLKDTNYTNWVGVIVNRILMWFLSFKIETIEMRELWYTMSRKVYPMMLILEQNMTRKQYIW